MTQPLQIEHLDQTLRASGRIDAPQALRLRQMIYARERVGDHVASILFGLDQSCPHKHPAFEALYVEALTDYFVWQTEPRGHVSAGQARLLLDNVLRDGHVASRTELELLLNVVHWAHSVPDELSLQVIEAVRQQVLLSSDAGPGLNRPAFSVSAVDVAILRKALHAPAGEQGLLVSRREADMLLSLNDATAAGANDPSWQPFFCLALANHLLNPQREQALPDLDAAKARERWLDERGTLGAMLNSGVSSLLGGNIPFMDVWREIDITGAERARAEEEALHEETERRLACEQVDAEEATWLAGRMLASETIDENERALLTYLRKHAQHVDPALETVMARAGI